MAATILTWILGIISTLLGGLNIFQWITLKSYKRVKAAEADSKEIQSLSEIIKQNQAEIGRLSQRLTDADNRATMLENKYNSLFDKYDRIRDEFETYKQQHK